MDSETLRRLYEEAETTKQVVLRTGDHVVYVDLRGGTVRIVEKTLAGEYKLVLDEILAPGGDTGVLWHAMLKVMPLLAARGLSLTDK